MSTNLPRSAPPRPDARSTDCRHSRAAFDALFEPIYSRADLSDAAKLLHGRLVSMFRLGASWTQSEIGASLGGWSRQKVWRAVGELVARGLLAVKRIGLGLPNAYTLLGLDSADLEGSAPRFRSGHPEGRPAQHGGRGPLTEKRNERRSAIPTDPGAYLAGPYGAVVRR